MRAEVVLTRPIGDDAEPTEFAVGCLSKLIQIDFDLILKDIPRILPELLHVCSSSPRTSGSLKLYADPTRVLVYLQFPGVVARLPRQNADDTYPHRDPLFSIGDTSAEKFLL